MGLITLILLALFSLLYLSSSISKKATIVEKLLAWIQKNLNHLALAGLIYGVIATCLTPIIIHWPLAMFIRIVANILLVVMALPFMFDRFKTKHGAKVNSAILGELSSLVDWIRTKAFVVGMSGCIMSLLVFAVVFR